MRGCLHPLAMLTKSHLQAIRAAYKLSATKVLALGQQKILSVSALTELSWSAYFNDKMYMNLK